MEKQNKDIDEYIPRYSVIILSGEIIRSEIYIS